MFFGLVLQNNEGDQSYILLKEKKEINNYQHIPQLGDHREINSLSEPKWKDLLYRVKLKCCQDSKTRAK